MGSGDALHGALATMSSSVGGATLATGGAAGTTVNSSDGGSGCSGSASCDASDLRGSMIGSVELTASSYDLNKGLSRGLRSGRQTLLCVCVCFVFRTFSSALMSLLRFLYDFFGARITSVSRWRVKGGL